MGKNKNKGGRNGFYFFMLDFKKKQGQSYKSMAQVAEAAGPFWTRMSKEEKKPYELMATREKENSKKQTSLGESIDSVLQEDAEMRIREQNVKNEIDKVVGGAVRSLSIADQYFYIMHANDFCFCSGNGRFYAAEIALGRFRLRDGIKVDEVYHSFVQPGSLPIGYSAEAKRHSEETHQIPPPLGPDAENNTLEVLTSIISFLTDQADEAASFPPIYVHEQDILKMENILDNMCADYDHNIIFKIYPLQYLLFVMRNSISKSDSKIWPTVTVSKLELEKDVYDFCKGIPCDFHENSDTPIHCSRSKIIRAAYIICDNCIKDLDIDPILGQHIPFNAITVPLLRPGSAASAYSNRSVAQTSRSVYETPAESLMLSRSESRMSSSVSGRSTVVEESDSTSYRGFDSDSQADEEEPWQRPKARGRFRDRDASFSSSQQSQPEEFKMSQTSSVSDYVPKRRPVTMSGVLSTGSGGVGRAQIPGRGRGRGIVKKVEQQSVENGVKRLSLN